MLQLSRYPSKKPLINSSSKTSCLPGLSKTIGLSPSQLAVDAGDVDGLPAGELKVISLPDAAIIPVTELPKDLKDKIPTNFVFARSAGQMVDIKTALSLNSIGRPEQKISTISGKPLHLTIKPDKRVSSVRGYIVFRSRGVKQAKSDLRNFLTRLFLGEPATAQEVPVEQKLVLAEFEYTDPDGDGIYTADVQSPIPAGQYEIITIIDYEDPELGSRQIQLIAVVDPEGYVYEKISGKELRIPGAIATIYYYNPTTKQYAEWPAKDYQQENPQITDVRGTYSFLVPGGMYYLKVTAPGYLEFQSKPFPVEEGGGVHMNIEMKTKYWWLKIVDWKTGLLLAVALLLGWNFYKDRKRV